MLGSKEEYSRYYGDFRGVDFSNDHTQVHDQRFAYAVNMYRDYQSGQGKCIETIPGFRRRFEINPLKNAAALSNQIDGIYPIYGIHRHKPKNSTTESILIHAGPFLLSWNGKDAGVTKWARIILGDPTSSTGEVNYFLIDMNKYAIISWGLVSVFKADGTDITANATILNNFMFSVKISGLYAGDTIFVQYKSHLLCTQYALCNEMNTRPSQSFTFNDSIYIIDGKNYWRGSAPVTDAYIPTTYINIIPGGENADAGTQKEQRNMLSPYFKHTFIADGETTEFYMNENELDETDISVKVYGVEAERWFVNSNGIYSDKTGYEMNPEEIEEGAYVYVFDAASGKITFLDPVARPEETVQKGDLKYPAQYAGIEITAKKRWDDDNGRGMEQSILKCTIATVFDNRVFFSGNPDYPNRVFWSALNNPTYVPSINWEDMGVGDSPVTGMMPISDTLMVLKGDTQQDGSVYYLTPKETGDDLNPKIYVKSTGLSGTGCLGPCINFLDDPVFISRLGLEAMGQLSVRLERAVEHRSSLVDAKLTALDLSKASMVEWNGYLVILVGGKIFMADSRQRYADDTGVMQYEWYYLEDIGVWDGQYEEYRYASSMRADMYLYDDYGVLPRYVVKYCKGCGKSCICERKDRDANVPGDISGCSCADHGGWINLDLDISRELGGEVVNPPDENGNETETVTFTRLNTRDDYEIDVFYHIRKLISPHSDDVVGYEALLCTTRESYTGGVFRPATTLAVIDNNLFFGTENGVICSFNFDMRNDLGEIPKEYYSFDNRTIFCGVATKMDNCGYPHLTKNTVKKSTVIKTKTMQTSGAKVKVRTNRRPYEQIARISSGQFMFDSMDFSDFSFVTTEHNLFAVKEKEKKWVEKQYFLYSDEYRKPFSLFYIAYRYNIAGRYKEPK